jgi:hypothetical protein
MRNRVLQVALNHRLGLLSGACILAVFAAYVFFVSAGTWTSWPETNRYYDDLATALCAGHLYLDKQPPPALLDMAYPYAPGPRNNITGLREALIPFTDLTYFGGRFYLYWGPAPAAILCILKLAYAAPVSDRVLVFGFLAGLLLFTTGLSLELRRRCYPSVPIPLVLTGLVVAALAVPIPWMLAHGRIYDATIAAGQFFLVGGLYFAYTGIQHSPAPRGRLILAAAFWALAGASRTMILLPAGFLTLMLISWVATSGGKKPPAWNAVRGALVLALPLALTVIGLGWYNWARFGSVLETGLRYTLTYRDLNRFYDQAFSVNYLLPSLWVFLVHPFQTLSNFPYISATYGQSPLFLYLGPVRLYHAEAITGVLFSVPFAVLSTIAAVNTVRALLGRPNVPGISTSPAGRQLLWLIISLSGAAFLPFVALLLYFNVAMRFIAEFLPSLMLLAVLGLWQGYLMLEGKSIQRLAYVSSAVALSAVTVAISLLLTIAEYHT